MPVRPNASDVTVPSTQLCLSIGAGPATHDRLGVLLVRHSVASVVLTPLAGRPLAAEPLLPLIALLQTHDVAALLADEPRLARTLKADGCHLRAEVDGTAAYTEARDILGRRAIVGAEAGLSRHQAMSLAEAGAEYVGFAVSGEGRGAGLDLIDWWADLFQVPCIALDVTDAETARAAAAAGADFVQHTIDPALPADALLDRVDAIAAAIGLAAPVRA
jgi:thiamine-phosphate pyrophosphorylase